jgi:hypothetical protein
VCLLFICSFPPGWRRWGPNREIIPAADLPPQPIFFEMKTEKCCASSEWSYSGYATRLRACRGSHSPSCLVRRRCRWADAGACGLRNPATAFAEPSHQAPPSKRTLSGTTTAARPRIYILACHGSVRDRHLRPAPHVRHVPSPADSRNPDTAHWDVQSRRVRTRRAQRVLSCPSAVSMWPLLRSSGTARRAAAPTWGARGRIPDPRDNRDHEAIPAGSASQSPQP